MLSGVALAKAVLSARTRYDVLSLGSNAGPLKEQDDGSDGSVPLELARRWQAAPAEPALPSVQRNKEAPTAPRVENRRAGTL